MPDEPEHQLLPGPVDYDHAHAIASAISAWAAFEYKMDEEIWEMAHLEPTVGACLTAQFSTVVARFNALIALAHGERLGRRTIVALNKLKEEAGALAEQRNRIVHDPWLYAYPSGRNYRLQRTAKGSSLISEYRPVTTDELRKIEAVAKRLTDRLSEISQMAHAERYARLTSRDKPREGPP